MVRSLCIEITAEEKQQLLEIARQAIAWGFDGNKTLNVDAGQFGGNLDKTLASFVTLKINNVLRGCIGSLRATEELAQSVAGSAYKAAFHDPRFPGLTKKEMDSTDLEISVLSPMEVMSVTSHEDLLSQLNPGIDGLLLEDGHRRATFLPQVWENLPEPKNFVGQLMIKAGLTTDYWSPTIQFHRYYTVSLHE